MNVSGFVTELFQMWIPSKYTEIFTMIFDLKIRQKVTELETYQISYRHTEFYAETLNLIHFVTEIFQ